MTSYADFYRRSIEDRDAFWAEQAQLVDWQQPPQQICDYSRPPFANWFAGGTTNLCHNAVDRHLAGRAEQAQALLDRWRALFGERYCLEIWRTGRRDDEPHLAGAVDLAARSGTPLFYSPTPGAYLVRAVDDLSRSDARELRVEYAR